MIEHYQHFLGLRRQVYLKMKNKTITNVPISDLYGKLEPIKIEHTL